MARFSVSFAAPIRPSFQARMYSPHNHNASLEPRHRSPRRARYETVRDLRTKRRDRKIWWNVGRLTRRGNTSRSTRRTDGRSFFYAVAKSHHRRYGALTIRAASKNIWKISQNIKYYRDVPNILSTFCRSTNYSVDC